MRRVSAYLATVLLTSATAVGSGGGERGAGKLPQESLVPEPTEAAVRIPWVPSFIHDGELGEWADRAVKDAGHRVGQPPYDAFFGSRYAIVIDPDGNEVGLKSPIDDAAKYVPEVRT